MINICPALLADVKNYLDITWNDDATDRKVSGIVANGMHYLNMKGGPCLDFENNRLANQLLKDYTRYARDNALDVFENNYKALLLALHTERQVSLHVEDTEQTK